MVSVACPQCICWAVEVAVNFTNGGLTAAEMKDIASQLVLKWARKGPEHRIFATDDFTRLTLDTIALCAMDYRFNSFYQDSMHPFVDAMLASLSEGGRRSNRPAFINALRWSSGAKLKADRDYMRQVGTEIVNIRRSNPSDKKDLLNAMIHGVDPKTGAKLRDELIIAQMVGFLVAGTEAYINWRVLRCMLTNNIFRPRNDFRIVVIHIRPSAQESGCLQEGPAGGRRSCWQRIDPSPSSQQTEIRQCCPTRSVAPQSYSSNDCQKGQPELDP